MTRDEAVAAVRRLLDDGQRIDRYLRITPEGSYFLTDAEAYLKNHPDGHDEQDHAVKIPWIDGGTDLTEEEYESEAETLVDRLDEQIEDCEFCGG